MTPAPRRALICPWFARAALYALAALLSTTAHAETPASDPKAVAIADQVMQALGGKDHWDKMRGLRWTFGAVVNDTVRGTPRRHSWDKMTGWHRVEGKTRAGQAFCLIHNMNYEKSMAWMDGKPIEGDSLAKLTKMAKSMWTNDTYWFLMPYKLRDPGVNLKYAGEAKLGGQTYDKLALSFEHVGETPGDRYWVYVNRATHRVDRWDFLLEGDKPPPETWRWEDWTQSGGMWFCTAHRNNEKTNVFTRDVQVVSQFRPTEFSAP